VLHSGTASVGTIVTIVSQPFVNCSPRLLKKGQAAAYCGLSESAFLRICPVGPLNLGKSILRWDIVEIDKWIDSLSIGNVDIQSMIDGLNDKHKSKRI